MSGKKISIIIPAKNCEETISETLHSIKYQTYKNFEVLIVDDGSTDNTKRVIDTFNHNENVNYRLISLIQSGGASKARNTGASNASGEVLVFADSDIILSENALEEGMKFWEENKDISIFFGAFSTKTRIDNLLSRYKNFYLCYTQSKLGERTSFLDTSLCFIDKSTFDNYKFNESIRYMSEDVDLAMRMTKNGCSIGRALRVRMEHLKRYSLKSFVKAEYIRGKTFCRLFLRSLLKDKKESGKATYTLKPLYVYVNVGLMPFLIIFTVLSLIINNLEIILFSLIILLSLILSNLRFWNFLRKENGLPFALKSVFISFLTMVTMDIGIAVTITKLFIDRNSILGSE